MTTVRDIPQAHGHWLLGNAMDMKHRPLEFVARLGLQNGGIGRFRILNRRFVAITHPDLIKEILVSRSDTYLRGVQYQNSRVTIGKGLITTDGAEWKVRRRQIQPAFRNEHVRKVVPATHLALDEAFARWNRLRTADRPIPLVDESQTLTSTIMGRALLSISMDSNEALTFARAVRDSLYVVRKRNVSMCPMPLWVKNSANRALLQTRDILDTFVTKHLKPRTQPDAARRDDIAQELLDARDPETGEALGWQAILDETKTLFTAGFETTATSLAWTLHLLSHHPEIQKRWHAEIDAILPNGKKPTWEDLDNLKYTHQIINETMRLYPPVYTIARTAQADDNLFGSRIKAGDNCVISIYGAHRTPEFWPEPESFLPDRFCPDQKWTRHAFLPFALGKHLCIGSTMATAEIATSLAAIGQRYRILPTGPRQVPTSAQITLVPKNEIFVHMEPRQP